MKGFYYFLAPFKMFMSTTTANLPKALKKFGVVVDSLS